MPSGERMFMTVGACLALGLCFGTAAYAADDGAKPGGNYTELLTVNMKAGGHAWRLDKTYTPPGNMMMEYVPEGQTGQNWSEMITTITFTSQPQPNTGNIIAGIVRNFRGICGKLDLLDQNTSTETDELRKSVGLPATYQTFSVLLRCDDPKPSPNPAVTVKKHEVLWLKGIQGWLYSYLVQRAWHSDDLAPDSILISDKTHKEWQDWGQNVRISGIPDDKRPKK